MLASQTEPTSWTLRHNKLSNLHLANETNFLHMHHHKHRGPGKGNKSTKVSIANKKKKAAKGQQGN
jgi:hypothetical protein